MLRSEWVLLFAQARMALSTIATISRTIIPVGIVRMLGQPGNEKGNDIKRTDEHPASSARFMRVTLVLGGLNLSDQVGTDLIFK